MARWGALLVVAFSACLDLGNGRFIRDGGLPGSCAQRCQALQPGPQCSDEETLVSYRLRGCDDTSCQFLPVTTTCEAGCDQGQCTGDACAGVFCEVPPAPTCLDARTLRASVRPGACTNGQCGYSTVDLHCQYGCQSGQCVDEPCVGAECSVPPPAVCVGSALRTFGGGTCSAAAGCSFFSADVPCTNGCANGACLTNGSGGGSSGAGGGSATGGGTSSGGGSVNGGGTASGGGSASGQWRPANKRPARYDAVWGASPTDIWATDRGYFWHFDGSQWSGATSPTALGVQQLWGSSAHDIYGVGEEGVFHFDGTVWSHLTIAAVTQPLTAVWGSSANDVWVGGATGLMVHSDGTTWSAATVPDSGPYADGISSISGTGPNDVWAGRYRYPPIHFNGQSWSVPNNTGYTRDLRGILAVTPTLAFAFGNGIMRWNGATWVDALSSTTFMTRAGAKGANDIWFTSNAGHFFHFNGTSVTEDTTQPQYPSPDAVWTPAGDAPWFFGTDELTRLQGSRWVNVVVAADLKAVWATSQTRAFAVGAQGTLAEWNGAAWQRQYSGITESFNALWASGPDDVWAVGDNGVIWHRSATGWQAAASPTTQTLSAVWGVSANDVWAVGDQGPIVHFDGTRWSNMNRPDPAPLSVVWGDAPNNVWVLGGDTTPVAYRWNGAGWQSFTINIEARAIRGFASNDIWATGINGGAQAQVAHFDGTRWSSVATGVYQGSNEGQAFWGASSSEFWGAFRPGTFSKGSSTPTSWGSVPTPLTTSQQIFGIHGTGAADVWAVGTAGTVLHYTP